MRVSVSCSNWKSVEVVVNTLKEYEDLKIVIHGKTYGPVDELPESVKKVIGARLSAIAESAQPSAAPIGTEAIAQSEIKEPETLGNRIVLVTMSVLFVGWFLFKLGVLHA